MKNHILLLRQNSVSLICIVILTILSQLFMVLLVGMRQREELTIMPVVITNSINHSILNAICWTPIVAIAFKNIIAHCSNAYIAHRIGGLSQSIQIAIIEGTFITLIITIYITINILIFNHIWSENYSIPPIFLIVLIISYLFYFETCILIYTFSFMLTSSISASFVILIGYGIFPYILGMSPLRNSLLFRIGWLLIPELNQIVSISFTFVIKQFLITFILLISCFIYRRYYELRIR